MKLPPRGVLIRRGFDVLLVAAVIYAALLAAGVIRRGGRFEEGRPAPAFTVRRIDDGRTVGLDDYAGKTLVLTFFSTTCPSCKREIPDLSELRGEVGDRVEFLVITSDNPRKVSSWFDAEGLELPLAWDDGSAHDAFGVDTIPYSVVIGPDGTVRTDIIGGLRKSDVL